MVGCTYCPSHRRDTSWLSRSENRTRTWFAKKSYSQQEHNVCSGKFVLVCPQKMTRRPWTSTQSTEVSPMHMNDWLDFSPPVSLNCASHRLQHGSIETQLDFDVRNNLHARRQTILLSIPASPPNRSFLQLLAAHLRLTFGSDVRLEVYVGAGCLNRCCYRLSDDWHRPTEVHDALVALFSVFQTETANESPFF